VVQKLWHPPSLSLVFCPLVCLFFCSFFFGGGGGGLAAAAFVPVHCGLDFELLKISLLTSTPKKMTLKCGEEIIDQPKKIGVYSSEILFCSIPNL